MGALSNYAEEKFVEHFLRNNAIASPATVFLALFESDPGEAAGGTEATFVNYVRVACTWTALDAAGQTKNVGVVTFPSNGNASADSIITYGVVYDAITAGNRILHGPLASPKTLQVGDVLSFAANAMVLTID